MKRQIVILYQNNRDIEKAKSMFPDHEMFFYPEDNRTPKQRVLWLIELSKKNDLPEKILFVSSCGYIIEGIIKIFKELCDENDMKAFLENEEVSDDLEPIFVELSDPMQALQMFDETLIGNSREKRETYIIGKYLSIPA